MKIAQYTALACSLLLLCRPAAADEASAARQSRAMLSPDYAVLILPETVITAERVEQELTAVGRSVEVRTRRELDEQKVEDLTESLQDVSGVRAVNTGGPGAPGLAYVEFRGFPTRGTQVLLNGMALRDPSSVTGTYESFLPELTLDDIDHVEVLKGATGVLYGSDGQSGAVNLITRQPEEGAHASAAFEGGSYNTYKESGFLNYGADEQGAVLGVTHIGSEGLDAHGDYENTTFFGTGSVFLADDTLQIKPIVRTVNYQLDLDTSPTVDAQGELLPNQDTPKNRVEATSYLVGATADYKAREDLSSRLNAYFIDNSRAYLFDFSGFESTSNFDGSSLNFDWQLTRALDSLNSKITGGLNYEHQDYKTISDMTNEAQRDLAGAFVFDHTTLIDERLELAAGARVTHISDIDKNVPTFEGSAVYNVPVVESRLHGSIAEGFRAPTLFESQGRMADFNTGQVVEVGNRALDVEEALTFDAGIEQPLLGEVLTLDVTYFQIEADDTILFDYAGMTHLNSAGGKSRGVESSLLYHPKDWFYLRAAYTNVGEADQGDGERRTRVPYNWFSASSAAKWRMFTFSTEFLYRDSQQLAFFGTAERLTEPGVGVVNAALICSLTDNIELYAKARNIFDQDYTEGGYTMPGASLYGGVRLKL